MFSFRCGWHILMQLPSGTWYLKVNNRTGERVSDVELIPAEVIRFLDRLGKHRDTLTRAGKWMMDNPVKTFDWKAQSGYHVSLPGDKVRCNPVNAPQSCVVKLPH